MTPPEALEILASAISYCRQAGLKVKAGNHGGALVLRVEGAELSRDASGRVQFRPSGSVPDTTTTPPL